MAKQKTTGDRARADVWKGAFLIALSHNGNVSGACLAAEIDRSAVYRAKDDDPEFAARWDEALKIAVDRLEAEAWRRAVDGVDEPVFQKGVQVGAIRKYSDTLMAVLLKAHNPDKYREKIELIIKVTPEQAVFLKRLGLSPEEAWNLLLQEIAQDVYGEQLTIDAYANQPDGQE